MNSSLKITVIVFLDNQDFVRMKLRTLLRAHGYKRRTAGLNEYLKQCMYFYHIETFIKGGEKCDIGDIALDDMVTFRVLQNIRPYIAFDLGKQDDEQILDKGTIVIDRAIQESGNTGLENFTKKSAKILKTKLMNRRRRL